MITQTLIAISKSLDSPDETREFPNGKVELVHLSDTTIGRITLQPGWKWSNDVKPIVKTESCQENHTGFVISGRLMVAMDDGAWLELKPGDAVAIPAGHDAWVLGNEPFVMIDVTGVTDYARLTKPT